MVIGRRKGKRNDEGKGLERSIEGKKVLMGRCSRKNDGAWGVGEKRGRK